MKEEDDRFEFLVRVGTEGHSDFLGGRMGNIRPVCLRDLRGVFFLVVRDSTLVRDSRMRRMDIIGYCFKFLLDVVVTTFPRMHLNKILINKFMGY